MTPPLLRRAAAACALAAALAAPSLACAQAVSGPDPALAPGQDERAVGVAKPSTVYRDADGSLYVLGGPDEKQFLSGYNVTWVDKDHVIGPPGFGGFD